MNSGVIKGLSTLCLSLAVSWASANDFAEAIKSHADSSVKSWLGDSVIVNAVKSQNSTNAGLSQSDVDRLDKEWRAEVSAANKPTIDKVLGNDLSKYLKAKQESSNGLYTEIFVMDNKGLNVGQSGITSDYWQGDEAKWQQTYTKGADSIHISDVEEDESTQTFQSQLSLPLLDPATEEVIGAITIGINVDAL